MLGAGGADWIAIIFEIGTGNIRFANLGRITYPGCTATEPGTKFVFEFLANCEPRNVALDMSDFHISTISRLLALTPDRRS